MPGRGLPGARLRTFAIEHKDAPGLPLVVRVVADVPALARRVPRGLSIGSVFPLNLAELASLAEPLAPVYCLGLCASGPAAMIDGQPVARLTAVRFDALVAELTP